MTNIVKITSYVELVNEINPFVVKAKPRYLDALISNMPENTYAFFTNKSFEDNSFIMMINGQWKFYQNHKFEDWCWEKDFDSIYESYISEDDIESAKEFTYGFEYNENFEYPLELEEFIRNEFKLTSEPLSIDKYDLLRLVGETHQKATVLNIIEQDLLSNNDKADMIIDFIKKQIKQGSL